MTPCPIFDEHNGCTEDSLSFSSPLNLYIPQGKEKRQAVMFRTDIFFFGVVKYWPVATKLYHCVGL
jgi:hypothetical protein